jgi:hypothetical protein
MTQEDIISHIEVKGVFHHGPLVWDEETGDALITLKKEGKIRSLNDKRVFDKCRLLLLFSR